jgi:ubiquinone/menaquinone biosynthesis C-methylase UbiE
MAGEFKLEDVLPWGRNRAEYEAFFDLASLDPGTRILDCAGGPASFNAEMTTAGYRVTSVDPLYQFAAGDIAGQVEATREKMLAGLRAALHRFTFTWHGSIERHDQIRMAAVRRFLDDFEAGKQAGRYRVAALPQLPFADRKFDLALCSHFLFLYSEHLNVEQHMAHIEEMMRVAAEARIFPLLDLDGEPSRHLDPVRERLAECGYDTAVQRVAYEFQKGGHSMLRVTAR